MLEADLAAEYYALKLQEDAIKDRLQAIRDVFIVQTGKRIVGDYQVNVSSSTVERLDGEACKVLLQEKGIEAPMQKSVQVRLTVKPALQLEA
jgi:hypothetical protein